MSQINLCPDRGRSAILHQILDLQSVNGIVLILAIADLQCYLAILNRKGLSVDFKTFTIRYGVFQNESPVIVGKINRDVHLDFTLIQFEYMVNRFASEYVWEVISEIELRVAPQFAVGVCGHDGGQNIESDILEYGYIRIRSPVILRIVIGICYKYRRLFIRRIEISWPFVRRSLSLVQITVCNHIIYHPRGAVIQRILWVSYDSLTCSGFIKQVYCADIVLVRVFVFGNRPPYITVRDIVIHTAVVYVIGTYP